MVRKETFPYVWECTNTKIIAKLIAIANYRLSYKLNSTINEL